MELLSKGKWRLIRYHTYMAKRMGRVREGSFLHYEICMVHRQIQDTEKPPAFGNIINSIKGGGRFLIKNGEIPTITGTTLTYKDFLNDWTRRKNEVHSRVEVYLHLSEYQVSIQDLVVFCWWGLGYLLGTKSVASAAFDRFTHQRSLTERHDTNKVSHRLVRHDGARRVRAFVTD